MKHLKNYLLISVIGSLTVACHDQRTDHATKQTAATTLPTTVIKPPHHTAKILIIKPSMLHKTQPVNNRLTLAKQQHYQINQQTFSTKTGRFIRGAQLYNIALHQQVRITGALIIVLYPNNPLPEKIALLGSVSKIAKDTFKIQYPTEQNMLMVYQQFKKNPTIKVVEMGLDYTPQNKQALK